MNNKNKYPCLIAQKYAQVIFDVAMKNNKVSYWQNILEFLTMLISDNLIYKLINHPILYNKVMNVIVNACVDILNLQSKSFLLLIFNNKRFNILPDILFYFKCLKNKNSELIIIDVISAKKLSIQQKSNLNNKILSMLSYAKYKIKLNNIIDSNIIGGIILRINNTVFDGSILNHLNQLKNFLKN
ncbi:MAG: ATP synthase F1 subunit delta [Candidatus Lightella neohaematopini]|nr:ATP synthase F1 subunit delta [Candidatus Lightella neohaematopini]MCV2529053.1 ATP synthase F1 subunit delta [Candidatus Lightella neohaematopini]